jgi:UDP-N-acetylmuramate--alanine ligase
MITYYPRVEERVDEELKTYYVEKTMPMPDMRLQVPGGHLLHDAHLAYTIGRLLGMQDDIIIPKLESYRGSWRRSEIIGTTKNGNILMSDYGHHPNEIRPTLAAIREKYADKKLFVVFQPHQYSRTRELLQEFASSFSDVDQLLIPDIYFSRDKKEDVEWMTVERFVETLQKTEDRRQKTEMKIIQNGNGLENTAKLIREYDEQNPNSSLILLLGAGDVDGLRHEIL